MPSRLSEPSVDGAPCRWWWSCWPGVLECLKTPVRQDQLSFALTDDRFGATGSCRVKSGACLLYDHDQAGAFR